MRYLSVRVVTFLVATTLWGQTGPMPVASQRALVTHWFNPPHIVPTVEIVPSPLTGEEVTQAVLALHRSIGKLAIVIRRELPGFAAIRTGPPCRAPEWAAERCCG